MRVVRYVLAALWMVLIVSLFWDPLTPKLTDPRSHWSPFRLDRSAQQTRVAERYACPLWVETSAGAPRHVDWRGEAPGHCDARCPTVQGECLIAEPYPMGTRIFWTMLVPLVPIFLLVFGHETWRRICPLAGLSQIPRYLGWQRKKKHIDPKTGRIERKLVLIKPESWLARNAMVLQFFFLAFGVTARLLLINADRSAMGLFLLGIIAAAVVVGYLFGGKTWCNYFCPIAPVQKIYTEPGGLLEGRAHRSLPVISGSACRTAEPSGKDQNACVGCTTPCADIDLERAYWHGVLQPGRRFVYYGYFGLVLGFYTYYRLFAGSWVYYFSGIWTREKDLRAQLWKPGWYFGDYAVPVPKWIAAPVTMAVFIFGSYGLGCLLETLWTRVRAAWGRSTALEIVRHQSLSVACFASFNTFYQFGGRPNILLFSPAWRTAVDVLVVFVSTVWLVSALGRSSRLYERESLASSLRRQLRKLKLDFSKVLGERSLEELGADEVYLLAKTLPELSAQQRRETYKDTVRESLRTGHASTTVGLSMLEEVREKLGVSAAEHEAVLQELGVEDARLLDPDAHLSQEEHLRMESYREALEALLLSSVQQGMSVQTALAQARVQIEVRRLQSLYNVTPEEQQKVVLALFGQGSGAIREAQTLLERMGQLRRRRERLASLQEPELALYVRLLSAEQALELRDAVRRVLQVLVVAGPTTDAMDVAEALGRVAGKEVVSLLSEESAAEPGSARWRELLSPGALAIFENVAEDHAGSSSQGSVFELLRDILREPRAVSQACALALWVSLQPSAGKQEAQRLLETPGSPLVRDTAERLLGRSGALELGVLARLGRLWSVPLFRDMNVHDLGVLARDTSLRRYKAGEFLCEQGQSSHEILVLSAGRAEVRRREGGRELVLRTVLPGEAIGELGVLAHSPRTASVLALDSDTEALAIPGPQLEALLLKNASMALVLLRTVSQRWTTAMARESAATQ